MRAHATAQAGQFIRKPLEEAACTSAGLGDETDLAADTDATSSSANADGTLSGSAKGMGSQVPVTVTLDADGKIASVEAVENTETEGIGSKAIEQMLTEFVGLSTAEEIGASPAPPSRARLSKKP